MQQFPFECNQTLGSITESYGPSLLPHVFRGVSTNWPEGASIFTAVCRNGYLHFVNRVVGSEATRIPNRHHVIGGTHRSSATHEKEQRLNASIEPESNRICRSTATAYYCLCIWELRDIRQNVKLKLVTARLCSNDLFSQFYRPTQTGNPDGYKMRPPETSGMPSISTSSQEKSSNEMLCDNTNNAFLSYFTSVDSLVWRELRRPDDARRCLKHVHCTYQSGTWHGQCSWHVASCISGVRIFGCEWIFIPNTRGGLAVHAM